MERKGGCLTPMIEIVPKPRSQVENISDAVMLFANDNL